MDAKPIFNYQGFRIHKEESGTFSRSVQQLESSCLPEGEVTIRVLFSGLNYKDALSAYGRPGVTRNYPHTPGIDAAGIVENSDSPDFSSGDKVLVTSYDLGMDTDGGFGQFICVPAAWVIPLPSKMTLRESMVSGTSGLTAAQGIYNLLEAGQKPENGPIVVTGARGAVGSYAVGLLSHIGFEVHAAVSKHGDDTDNLIELGASQVIDSSTTDDKSGRALLKPRWAGGFDAIGGNTLATILKSTMYGGNIVCVGNIESGNLSTTVYPFIIRGVKLIGVATQDTSMDLRKKLWDLLSDKWKLPHNERFVKEIGLKELDHSLAKMINKKSRGKIILNLWK